ncbi:hypothetical protein LguiA_008217 [Lonicera macranthoides]
MADYGVFLVNISFGEPSVPQLLVMDTGSGTTWIKCRPCDSYQPIYPIYEPSKSSTYSKLPCDSRCTSYDCLTDSECPYFVKYADQTTSSGNLATEQQSRASPAEQLTFTTSDEGTTTVSNFVFGCAHNFKENQHYNFNGIVGLSDHGATFSLVRQLGSKFSYCLGSINDPYYNYNRLILGNGSIFEGSSTPIYVNDYYFLSLEGISIGESRLNIDPNIFKYTEKGTSGVLFDTGSTYTYLTRIAFEALIVALQTLMDGRLQRFSSLSYPDHLCYKGIINRDLEWFRGLIFHFAEGADLVVPPDNMFLQNRRDSTFCLAVQSSESISLGNQSIIGALAQQYYNFGYDLTTNRLYFEKIDCQLLTE